MAKIERKLKNSLFMVAVDYLFNEKIVESQKEFCERIGITQPTLSRIKSNETTVSDATIRKMNEEFGGRFNLAYFRGESTYFLLSDLMEAEFERQNKPQIPVEESIKINTLLAERDIRLKEKDDMIATLQGRIKDKDDLITSLRQQLAFLTTANSHRYDFTENPLPIAAES